MKSILRLTAASSSGEMGSCSSAGELKSDIATSPSPERETFHFCEVGAVSAWRADSGSGNSLDGEEGACEMVMLGDGSGLRFQMAILTGGCWKDGAGLVLCYARCVGE